MNQTELIAFTVVFTCTLIRIIFVMESSRKNFRGSRNSEGIKDVLSQKRTSATSQNETSSGGQARRLSMVEETCIADSTLLYETV